MNKVMIEATKSTPEVLLDPETNTLMIKGQSYPENSYKFYEPIIEWIEVYSQSLEEDVQVTIEFDLPYINTSSSKCLMMVLDKLDEAYQSNNSMVIQWYCDLQNESEVECIEEFIEDLEIPCQIQSRP